MENFEQPWEESTLYWELGGAALAEFDSPPFQQFEQALDEQLEQLVAQWQSRAAPNAFRQSLGRRKKLAS